MSRMLFLRDIQVDIQMRCRDCGHEGVLARRDLERRFGPNYPVLSIAPHYRCSRCNSKEVESRPAPDAGASFASPMVAEKAEDFGGALGALQGLLASVRGERGEEDVHDLMGDDLLDTMVEEEEEPPPARPPVDDDRFAAEEDYFDAILAKLAPARRFEDEAPEPAPEPEPEPPPPTEQSPFDETLAALRALTASADDEEPEEDHEPEDLDEDPGEDLPDELPEDLDEIPDAEILSFAIRDPDARGVPDEPDASATELDMDEPSEDEEPDEDEEDEDPFPFRRPPQPEPGSLDESLAALRALVEKAAAEDPEPERAEKPEEPEPEKPEPPVLKTAQEKSLEETLAQLRGMLDLDKDSGDEGEPVVKPRKR